MSGSITPGTAILVIVLLFLWGSLIEIHLWGLRNKLEDLERDLRELAQALRGHTHSSSPPATGEAARVPMRRLGVEQ